MTDSEIYDKVCLYSIVENLTAKEFIEKLLLKYEEQKEKEIEQRKNENQYIFYWKLREEW